MSASHKIKSILAICVLSFVASWASGQNHTLRIRINQIPVKHMSDSIYIAGNFNNWDPSASFLKINSGGSSRELDLTIPRGSVEFKFTRGGWDKVEVNAAGKNISNRVVRVENDTTINISIEGWADDFSPATIPSTRSGNVFILDSAFQMPQLSRKRKIWVYLPKNYQSSAKRYPVLYMHDAQNLFDEATAANGEWNIDESLDSLSTIAEVGIVVGIENGPERMTEYNPYNNAKFGTGEGTQYIDFIVKTLKPFIDKKYRTLASREHTAIAGSSLGGLISYYAALKHPAVFGKAGIFSPSFWIAPEIKMQTDSLSSTIKSKLFFYIGGLEGDEHVSRVEDMADRIGGKSASLIYTAIDPDGLHNETSWRKWFPEFYRWIQSDWTNYIIRPRR